MSWWGRGGDGLGLEEGWAGGKGYIWAGVGGTGEVQLFREDLAGGGADGEEICVPEFEAGLSFEPAFADKKTIDDAGFVVFAARFFGRGHDFARDDGAVGFCDLRLFQLAGHDLLDLVFEPEGYFGHFGGGDGGGDALAA